MSIPEAVIEAASLDTDESYFTERYKDTARRVILALAEEMPEEAVGKAYSEFYANGVKTCSTREAIKAAIAAFLKDVVGETP